MSFLSDMKDAIKNHLGLIEYEFMIINLYEYETPNFPREVCD